MTKKDIDHVIENKHLLPDNKQCLLVDFWLDAVKEKDIELADYITEKLKNLYNE